MSAIKYIFNNSFKLATGYNLKNIYIKNNILYANILIDKDITTLNLGKKLTIGKHSIEHLNKLIDTVNERTVICK